MYRERTGSLLERAAARVRPERRCAMNARLAILPAILALLVPVAHASAATQVFFAFHRYTNTNSLLTVNLQDVYSGAILVQQSLRAGSGTSTNECYLAHGWLPG